jgi:hypothetical protein
VKGNPGIVDDALVHRRRHHRGEFAGTAAGERAIEQTEHVAFALAGSSCPAIRTGAPAGTCRMSSLPGCGGFPGQKNHEPQPSGGALGEQLAVAKMTIGCAGNSRRPAQAQLGADAGRFAAGDGDDRQCAISAQFSSRRIST